MTSTVRVRAWSATRSDAVIWSTTVSVSIPPASGVAATAARTPVPSDPSASATRARATTAGTAAQAVTRSAAVVVTTPAASVASVTVRRGTPVEWPTSRAPCTGGAVAPRLPRGP